MFPQVAYRTIGKSISPLLQQPAILSHFEQLNVLHCCEFSGTSVNKLKKKFHGEFEPQKGAIKKRYLRKFPLIRTAEDGTVTVEGVSNKQIPCPVPWREPKQVERFRPGEDASGDLADVRSLVDEKYLAPSEPKVEYEPSIELLESPPEVKRVSQIIYLIASL